jgi:pilus assembly protein Flp/PilA
MYNYVRIRLQAMTKSERGASAVEYGLLVALIAIAIIAGAFFLGDRINGLFTNTATQLS